MAHTTVRIAFLNRVAIDATNSSHATAREIAYDQLSLHPLLGAKCCMQTLYGVCDGRQLDHRQQRGRMPPLLPVSLKVVS